MIDPLPTLHPPCGSDSSPTDLSRSPSTLSVDSTASTTPPSFQDWPSYSVLCMYDFPSEDPDHLTFRKNEILDIVKEEPSGWWAAVRKDSDVVGWIPKAFVRPLADSMAERLLHIPEELRVAEYEAEQLYNSIPVYRDPHLYELDSPDSSHTTVVEPVAPLHISVSSSKNDVKPGWDASSKSLGMLSPSKPVTSAGLRRLPTYPRSPSTPVPNPPLPTPQASVVAPSTSVAMSPPTTRPLRPLPIPRQGASTPQQQSALETPKRSHMRSESVPLLSASAVRPLPVIGETASPCAKRLSMIDVTDDVASTSSPSVGGPLRARAESSAAASLAAIEQSPLPDYALPLHSDEIELDAEGQVRNATVRALVEKLTYDSHTKDPISKSEIERNEQFEKAFLITFRTFMTADELFDMLVDRYRFKPEGLSEADRPNWKDKCMLPTQRLVLSVLLSWLEDYRLLEEEPHIAQRLTNFLTLIMQPALLAQKAKSVIRTIERLTFAQPNASPLSPPRRKRKTRVHKGDLLRVDAADIAEQLCLIEFKLYDKITPQECLSQAKYSSGAPVSNITNFCATHDQLASWVKMTILNSESVSRRADMVDYWIKVAEKCRNLNNFSSMSAIVNALQSTVISRLQVTWSHTSRRAALDALVKRNDPTGGFSAYRALLAAVDGPCVPFIGMYLTDIVHIKDKFEDIDGRISFVQRQRWHEVISLMLRFQRKPYNIAESETTVSYISIALANGAQVEQAWFWDKGREVQNSELPPSDNSRGGS
ncbi:ras GEF [Fistulina hepatica ATCC 64428]|uniref:Ras GEF n=1 Tax=Fistulina hepatica ATCC 64428 TaxID=1128425 RepID=A0A0D7A8U2_9AGAR|nr:ras GEF [Fistulina hepatica ATCC 64428]